LVGGDFTTYSGSDCNDSLVRINAYTGLIDGSFNNSSTVGFINSSTVGFNIGGLVRAISAQDASGFVLVGGNFDKYTDISCNDDLVRINAALYGQRTGAIAIGDSAGFQGQQSNAIAIGSSAGQTSQQDNAIAIGYQAGQTGQGSNAIAIGYQAGQTNQGSNAIAIGYQAGQSNQPANTIAIGASAAPTALNPIQFVAVSAVNTIVNFKADISYNFTTGSPYKNFVIEHPLDPANKYLVHACLEGPEAGVYYCGTAFILPGTNSIEIALPIYADTLATEFTVHVTPIIDDDNDPIIIPTLASSQVKNGKFRVYGNMPCAFDYLVFGKRCEINVEPLKTAVTVKGTGPYTWI
jgi:hypothetical protein